MKIKLILAAVAVLAIGVFFFLPKDKAQDLTSTPQLTKSNSRALDAPILDDDLPDESGSDPLEGINDGFQTPPNRRFIQTSSNVRNNPEDWFEGAIILAQPGVSEDVSTNAVKGLLDDYAVIVKEGGYPTGLNHEIVNALLGANSKRIALLSATHPRINGEGELEDQWGTPYHFHFDSLTEVTVRSAGADMIMYTDDDILSENRAE